MLLYFECFFSLTDSFSKICATDPEFATLMASVGVHASDERRDMTLAAESAVTTLSDHVHGPGHVDDIVSSMMFYIMNEVDVRHISGSDLISPFKGLFLNLQITRMYSAFFP